MNIGHLDRVLAWVGAAHLLVAVVCLAALTRDAAPILGVHPAFKPMKFGFSIAVFLGTMAVIVPMLSIGSGWRSALAWILSMTMIVEMFPIIVQAVRGTTSHFNTQGTFNTALWQVMVVAIVIATSAMVGVAAVATLRPLMWPDGVPVSSLSATAWRAGLWMFLFVAVSGFSMGGRLRHSVGGDDGGPGLRLVNWSLTHGDLRVSHFVAMHAMQTLPAGRGFAGVASHWGRWQVGGFVCHDCAARVRCKLDTATGAGIKTFLVANHSGLQAKIRRSSFPMAALAFLARARLL